MFNKRGKMLWNVQQRRENAIKCSEKEGKCYEIFSKRGKMLWNFKQKRENAMKCSPKEGKCYEMFSKGGKMQWNVQQWGKMLWNVQQKRENAIKCSAKEEKCFEMFSKRGKMLWNVQQKRENSTQPKRMTLPSQIRLEEITATASPYTFRSEDYQSSPIFSIFKLYAKFSILTFS